jgi:protein TonB
MNTTAPPATFPAVYSASWSPAQAARAARSALAGNRLLAWALGASLLAHAAVLAVRFIDPQGHGTVRTDPRLEVVLVNAKGDRKPHTPQALAQADLDGGGDSIAGRRTSPLPRLRPSQGGETAEELRRAVERLEQEQRELLARQRESKDALARYARDRDEPAPTPAARRERQQLARMEAEISKEVSEYQKRPRVHRFLPSTSSTPWARYFEDWRTRVERIGTEHYPEEARGRVSSLRMTVVIDRDGSLLEAVIEESSGSPVLDAAARRIVKLASPFPPFPPDCARESDRLEITRSWMFTNDEFAVRAPGAGTER